MREVYKSVLQCVSYSLARNVCVRTHTHTHTNTHRQQQHTFVGSPFSSLLNVRLCTESKFLGRWRKMSCRCMRHVCVSVCVRACVELCVCVGG